ncbi:MAG: hypothetical protein AAF700_15595 [Pseudomonadota bacterium]
MKPDSVWVHAPEDISALVETRIDFDPSEPARAAILAGGEPDPKDFPVTAFEKYRDAPIEDLPPFFDGAGGLAFSKEIAEPIMQFDLGRTLILPLRILKHDRKTEIFAERGYHIKLRKDVFSAFNPNASTNLNPGRRHTPPTRWKIPWQRPLNDDDVAVTSAALDSPAFWTDPALVNSEFINGNVVRAMQSNDTAKYWHLKRCRIVD